MLVRSILSQTGSRTSLYRLGTRQLVLQSFLLMWRASAPQRAVARKRRRLGGPGTRLVAVFLAASFGIRVPADGEAPSAAGRIALVGEGPDNGIYTIEPTGQGLTRLTHGQDYRPRWSPDGTRIVFQRFDGEGLQSHIYVIDADGSNLLRLNSQPGFQPAWSPDGTRIVFGTGVKHNAEIAVMNADGSDVTRLTDNRFEEFLPAWSPDGATIAFTSRRHKNVDLYLMALDGTNVRRLTRNSAFDSNPDWSPSGDRIVFQSQRHHNWDLYSTLPDGTGLHRLTHGATADWAPAWSPDGSQIAFTIANYSIGREDVAVLDLETSIVVRFVIPETFELEPDWQPTPAIANP